MHEVREEGERKRVCDKALYTETVRRRSEIDVPYVRLARTVYIHRI